MICKWSRLGSTEDIMIFLSMKSVGDDVGFFGLCCGFFFNNYYLFIFFLVDAFLMSL